MVLRGLTALPVVGDCHRSRASCEETVNWEAVREKKKHLVLSVTRLEISLPPAPIRCFFFFHPITHLREPQTTCTGVADLQTEILSAVLRASVLGAAWESSLCWLWCERGRERNERLRAQGKHFRL